jgi:hypothetical protein
LLSCRHNLDANTVRPYNKDRVAVNVGLETGHNALDGRKGCFLGSAKANRVEQLKVETKVSFQMIQ